MSPLPSLAYARLAITVRNDDSTVTHVSTCIVNVNNVPFTLNTPFMILHLQIFKIMEGVRVSSYVSINSGKLHVLSRFDYVRVYARMSLIFLLLLLVIFHRSCVAGKCISSK